MAKKRYKHTIEIIEWDDAESTNTWEEIPKELKPAVVLTVGWVVKETERHLIVAGTYSVADEGTKSEADHINNYIQIPKGMVLSRTVLKKKPA